MSTFIFNEPVQAHKTLTGQLWPLLKAHLIAGRRMQIELRDWEAAKTDQQRRYYHGYILTEIARQAVPNGQRFALDVWKEFFRAKFLGTKRKTFTDPITGRRVWRNERVSSESLGVKGYNKLIEQVTAYAVTDLAVVFDRQMSEWIDPDTGEIVGAA